MTIAYSRLADYDPSMYSPRFDDALAYATASFRQITRKGTEIPYITHLLAVSALVGEGGGDEDQLIGAVLHDALEDIPDCTPEFLEARWGPRVRRLVVALSDSVNEHPKPAWRPRKERYIDNLRVESAEAKLISVADKLHNCTTLRRDVAQHGSSTFRRFSGGKDGTLWYYRSVAGALAHGWDHWLVDELIHEVARLEALAANR